MNGVVDKIRECCIAQICWNVQQMYKRLVGLLRNRMVKVNTTRRCTNTQPGDMASKFRLIRNYVHYRGKVNEP